ncbi:hypothetical protein J6590_016450 [Homalodisca vitripennis]|nr:hypothetical protein J6590_016450 [Homalodisca vitripennis]
MMRSGEPCYYDPLIPNRIEPISAFHLELILSSSSDYGTGIIPEPIQQATARVVDPYRGTADHRL